MKTLFLALIFAIPSSAFCSEYHYSVKVTDEVTIQAMKKTGSWKPGCPVLPEDLRIVELTHHTFEGPDAQGKILVHKSIATEVGDIFGELYSIGFPIAKLRLIDDYNASDDASMNDNNSSAFNCRPITGMTGQFSNHSWGAAIDLNPTMNPYFKPKTPELLNLFRAGITASTLDSTLPSLLNIFCLNAPENCLVLPASASNLLDRSIVRAGTVTPTSAALKIFTKHGWTWGGNWPLNPADRVRSDTQHFEKRLIQ